MHHQGANRDRGQDGPHVDLEVAPLDLSHHLRGAGVALELGEEPGGLRGVGDVLDVDPPIGTASVHSLATKSMNASASSGDTPIGYPGAWEHLANVP